MRSEINDVFLELVAFVRQEVNEFNLAMTRQTIIEDDLGVTGDEAEDFVIAFSKKYNVSIENFKFSKYFYPEPGIFGLQNGRISKLTLGHLEKAIKAGLLDEEVINS